jgi:predicted dehydrogenase
VFAAPAVEALDALAVSAPASVLVVGAGSAGYRHLMNARTLGVRNLSVFRASDGPPRGPLPSDVRVTRDFDAALSQGVEAVVVANPTAFHMDAALRAARAGCHLLVEKPLSHSLDGMAELQGAVRLQRITAAVGYQFRFHEAFRQIYRWLLEGAIGEVVSAHACWGERLSDWQPWRDYRTSYAARADLGGGVLLTLSHPIDYLRWLLGEVKRVSAVTRRRSGLELDVEDTALVHLEFESGAIGSVSLDYVQRPQRHALTIVGRCGEIHWNNVEDIARIDAPEGRVAGSRASFNPRHRRNRMFLVRICLAAKESAQSGRRIDV